MRNITTIGIIMILFASVFLTGCIFEGSDENQNDKDEEEIKTIEFVQITIHIVECYVSMDDWSSPDLFVKVEVNGDSEYSPTYDDTKTANMEWSCIFSTSQHTKVTIQVWDEDVSEHDYVGGFYTWAESATYEIYDGGDYMVKYSISYF